MTIDAGSIGIALSDAQQRTVRDVIVTHPHMDHIASLPIFVDDLFGDLHGPIRIHATEEVIELLKADVFNDTVYPKFDLLKNAHGHVMEYVPFEPGREFKVAHLTCTAITVNHIVPTIGLLISDGTTILAFSSDTAETGRLLACRKSSAGPPRAFYRSIFSGFNGRSRHRVEAFNSGDPANRADEVET